MLKIGYFSCINKSEYLPSRSTTKQQEVLATLSLLHASCTFAFYVTKCSLVEDLYIRTFFGEGGVADTFSPSDVETTAYSSLGVVSFMCTHTLPCPTLTFGGLSWLSSFLPDLCLRLGSFSFFSWEVTTGVSWLYWYCGDFLDELQGWYTVQWNMKHLLHRYTAQELIKYNHQYSTQILLTHAKTISSNNSKLYYKHTALNFLNATLILGH